MRDADPRLRLSSLGRELSAARFPASTVAAGSAACEEAVLGRGPAMRLPSR